MHGSGGDQQGGESEGTFPSYHCVRGSKSTAHRLFFLDLCSSGSTAATITVLGEVQRHSFISSYALIHSSPAHLRTKKRKKKVECKEDEIGEDRIGKRMWMRPSNTIASTEWWGNLLCGPI